MTSQRKQLQAECYYCDGKKPCDRRRPQGELKPFERCARYHAVDSELLKMHRGEKPVVFDYLPEIIAEDRSRG